MLYSHIVADIKRINAKHKNMKVNTVLYIVLTSVVMEDSIDLL